MECKASGYKTCFHLEIEGEAMENRRYKIIIGGNKIGIGIEELKILLRLAFHLRKDKKGWMKAEELSEWGDEIKSGVKQTISRLRKDLGREYADLIETKRGKGYRLSTHPDAVNIARGNLKKIKDEEIDWLLSEN